MEDKFSEQNPTNYHMDTHVILQIRVVKIWGFVVSGVKGFSVIDDPSEGACTQSD